MPKGKNGFTLMEVLGIIVVIAIILLITTPIIMNVLDGSKKESLQKTYEGIEKSAENYVFRTYDGILNSEVVIPVEELKDYATKLPSDSAGEYVVARDIGNEVIYYYTGRDKDPYDTSELLRALIERETSHIVMNATVNGKVTNKVIGDKIQRETMKNYVWYSGYLWQVIETSNTGIKLVMAHSISSIAFGETTNYKTSWVRKWLNDVSGDHIHYPNSEDRVNTGIFYNSLIRRDLLVDTELCLDAAVNPVEDLQAETLIGMRSRLTTFTPIQTCNQIISDKVGLLTLEDYAYAFDATLVEHNFSDAQMIDPSKRKKGGTMGYNFLDTDETMWLVTPSTSSSSMWMTEALTPGFITKDNQRVNREGRTVKPVITLKPSVKIVTGSGTRQDPFLIKGATNLKTGSSLQYAAPGEYIYINEENNPYESTLATKQKVRYRVIETTNAGIKIQRDDVLNNMSNHISVQSKFIPYYRYYDASVNSALWCNTTIHTGCQGYNYMKSEGIGNFQFEKNNSIAYFLNNENNGFYTWIHPDYQSLIKEVKWKLPVSGYEQDATKLQSITSYKNNGLEFPYRNYDGEFSGKISLPSWGDRLTGLDALNPVLNSVTVATGVSYWYQNRHPDHNELVSRIGNEGSSIGVVTSTNALSIRPVFHLDINTKILNGTGTKADPYQLKIQ